MSPLIGKTTFVVFSLRLLAVMAVFALPACQTPNQGITDGGTKSATDKSAEKENVSWSVYTPFYDQGDHFKSLLEDKNFADAAKLYAEQAEFFAQNRTKLDPILKKLAAHFNDISVPALEESLSRIEGTNWPAPVNSWVTIRKTLSAAKSALRQYPDLEILKDAALRTPQFERLETAANDLSLRIANGAPLAFSQFDHFGNRSFFSRFPLDLPSKPFMGTHYASISSQIEAASIETLTLFAANYPQDILGETRWARLGDLYVGAYLDKSGEKKPSLRTILGAVNEARKAGFSPKNVPGLKIGFIEATSLTLLKQGQIEFPARVDIDLPVNMVKADLDKALSTSIAKDSDYLIVFDVAMAQAKRRVTSATKVRSTVLTGYEKEPNPEYDTAQIRVLNAQSNLNAVRMQGTYNSNSQGYYSPGAAALGALLQGIAQGVATSSAKEKLQTAMTAMQETPRYVKKPVYADYKFRKATVKGTKTMTVNYYVIDRNRKTYFKSTFDVVEKKSFEVPYNIRDNDPNKESHLSGVDTEDTVAEWEEAPSSVKLSQLVDHYLANANKLKPLPDLVSLRKEMLYDKNKALAEYEANRFDARPLNDPRFDSVVVVYVSAKQSMGSGFFIKPDVVLTNWHVVEETKFIEMKMYDGRETFGKVIAKDIRLDLALIKVQSRGKPVQFFTNKTLNLGTTVEAIGHPRRFEFSITRGVVSAIRRLDNINISSATNDMGMPTGGGKDVLYIQMDAPISPGNSGGPLFFGDKVIGVNTWNRTDSQNLNFSVHYSEVLKFIKEYLPGFKTMAGR